MNKPSFGSDYIAGAHPRILARLTETNYEATTGYGTDAYSESARKKIKSACRLPDADVFFLVGGTQTNQTVIDTMLKPFEGVLCAGSGHIGVHEAGAIEFSGHKVITLPTRDGKIKAQDVDAYVTSFYEDDNHIHMVFPGMVYISFPTEVGTLYSRDELSLLHEVCRKHHLTLYVDGARLAYGLACPQNTLSLPEFAGLCDVFYIGGTKVGALFGEAVVFTNSENGRTPLQFTTQIKQHGALLAKGRLLGLQFDELFTDDLYFEIGREAVRKAMELKKAFTEKGYPLYMDSPTNQQFFILTKDQKQRLEEHFVFETWEQLPDGRAAVRFVTSWSTSDDDIKTLTASL